MITKVRLINFKCFEDETFQFKPLTLFAGLNGMGKSTVIQSLLLLRQNNEIEVLRYDKNLILNGELVQLGFSKDVLYQYFKLREIGIEVENDLFGNADGIWNWDASSDNDILPLLKSKSRVNSSIFNISLFNDKFHYLSAERIGPRLYFETSNYKVLNQNQLGTKGELAVNYVSEFQNKLIPISGLKHHSTTGLTLYEQVNAWLSEIRPGTRININTNLDMNLVGMSFQFVGGRDISNKFRSTNVGFGLSYVFSLVVAILSSEPGTLLIIENPEAHIHPRGQTQIAKLMAIAANNGVQIIVETHSDHILNGIRVSVKDKIISNTNVKLFYFSGEVIENQFKHYIREPNINGEGKLDEWPEGFFDEFEKQLANLL